MKKIIIGFLVLGFFFINTNQAKASLVDDLLNQIKSLKTELSLLKSNQGASVLGATVDTTPRIMYWSGKINQHIDSNGVWQTDPDGYSGASIDKLTYCKKFWPNTVSVEPYMEETIDTWRAGRNTGTYTGTKISDKCVQPQTTTQCAISSFTISPSTIAKGQSATITWNTSNCGNLSITSLGPISGPSGSKVVTPTTTTGYALIAINKDGRGAINSETKKVTVTEGTSIPSPTATITATDNTPSIKVDLKVNGSDNPLPVTLGSRVNVTWSVSGVVSCKPTGQNVGGWNNLTTPITRTTPAVLYINNDLQQTYYSEVYKKYGYQISLTCEDSTGFITRDIVMIPVNNTYSTKISSPCAPYGDVDNDGYLTEKDTTLMLKKIAGAQSLTYDQHKRADVNKDGVITVMDVTFIKNVISGTSTTFPVCTNTIPSNVCDNGATNYPVCTIEGTTPNTICSANVLYQRLQRRMTGDQVKSLQAVLNSLGYLGNNGIDGNFGNGTRSAVVQFQLNNGLIADGVVGTSTRRVLNNQWKEKCTATQTLTNSQSISLKAGWNIISFNVKPFDLNLSSVFANMVPENGEIIQNEDGVSATYNNGSWTGGFSTIDTLKAYKVKVSKDKTLTVSGNPISTNTNISLKTGTNLVPYYITHEQDAEFIFNRIGSCLKKVMDEEGNSYEDYGIYGGWKNNIGTLKPGEGYTIITTCPANLNYSSVYN